MSLRIVADENIPLAREAFGVFGSVQLLPGREIDASAVAHADALIVRSVTKVGPSLLEPSRVRFVGTATIGTDHVDLGYLERRGIAFTAAPGCNARSVAEYVVAALLELEVDRGEEWSGAVLGVIGVGNVGRRVAALGRVLGLEVLECDPPRAEREPGFRSTSLDEVIARAGAITFHVPLERGGRHPTLHLLDAARIARLGDGAVVINTSRGGVVDDEALSPAAASGRLRAVLDVWETEPDPGEALVEAVRLATPHIAGYSLDGKLAGTRIVAEALARLAGGAELPAAELFSPPVPHPEITVSATGRAAVRAAVRRVYAIEEDDARLRRALREAGPARASAFDRLRRDYPVRREFAGYVVAGASLGAAQVGVLRDLGFAVAR